MKIFAKNSQKCYNNRNKFIMILEKIFENLAENKKKSWRYKKIFTLLCVILFIWAIVSVYIAPKLATALLFVFIGFCVIFLLVHIHYDSRGNMISELFLEELNELKKWEQTLESLKKQEWLIKKLQNNKVFFENENLRIMENLQKFKNRNGEIKILENIFWLFDIAILSDNYHTKTQEFIEINKDLQFFVTLKSYLKGILSAFILICILALLAAYIDISKNFSWEHFYFEVLKSEFFVDFFSFESIILLFILSFPFFFFYLISAQKYQKYENDWLTENFQKFLQETIDYVEIIVKNPNSHSLESLIFVDIINFFSKNISDREKNLEEYETFFKKSYFLYFWKFPLSEVAEQFFQKEKQKIKNDAIIVIRLVKKWSQIESSRLSKIFSKEGNENILLASKRRELLISNFEKLVEK